VGKKKGGTKKNVARYNETQGKRKQKRHCLQEGLGAAKENNRTDGQLNGITRKKKKKGNTSVKHIGRGACVRGRVYEGVGGGRRRYRKRKTVTKTGGTVLKLEGELLKKTNTLIQPYQGLRSFPGFNGYTQQLCAQGGGKKQGGGGELNGNQDSN